MSQVHVFGLNHFHQNVEIVCVTASGKEDERTQKAGLADTLRQIIRENRIQLVAEEAKLDRPCLGRILAQENGIAYCNITMPIEDREKQGIRTQDYDRRDDTRRAAYKIFEHYMFDRVKHENAAIALILCGRYHLRALVELFEAAGDDVRAYDIQEYGWYRGRPMEAPEGVIGYDEG
jgi:hypothetical protein